VAELVGDLGQGEPGSSIHDATVRRNVWEVAHGIPAASSLERRCRIMFRRSRGLVLSCSRGEANTSPYAPRFTARWRSRSANHGGSGMTRSDIAVLVPRTCTFGL
jgi:hypothetical protein